MAVEINGVSVTAVVNAIRSANNSITGPYGCGKSMENVLKTLGNHWKSPDAVKFANGICLSLNPLLTKINTNLTSCCTTIVKNGNEWLVSQGAPGSLSNPQAVDCFKLSEANVSSIEEGVGGSKDHVLIPTSTEAATISGSIEGVKSAMKTALTQLKTAADSYPDAFKGAGQSELIGTLQQLSSNVDSAFEKFGQDFSTSMNKVGVQTDANVQTSKSNLGGSK